MAQYRQSGGGYDRLPNSDFAGSDTHVIGIRAPIKQSRHHRRSSHKKPPFSIPLLVFLFSVALIVTFFFAFYYLSQDVADRSDENDDDEVGNGADFLANVTRIEKSSHKFERGSVRNVRDSKDWDRDDRRRDEDYDEESADKGNVNVGVAKERLSEKIDLVDKERDEGKLGLMVGKGGDGVRKKGVGLYNEAGRDELKVYEAEYEASLKNAGKSGSGKVIEGENKQLDDKKSGKGYDSVLADEYDDGMAMESLDDHAKDYENDDAGKHSEKLSNEAEAHDHDDEDNQSSEVDGDKSNFLGVDKDHDDTVTDYADNDFSSITEETKNPSPVKTSKSSGSEKRTDVKKKSKRRKLTGCDMKLLNSTAQLVEPVESKKFVRFSLQYTAIEEVPQGNVQWEPRFAGHQSLEEREASFLAHDQTINCGFVKSPEGYPSTGFDISEDDTRYISTCHIAVVSCIFGNSDNLRTPTGKTVTRLSKKNVCFVMFVDEVTMQTLSAEGHTPDSGYIGLWKVVTVKNLPYTDMRRVGKVPKFLAHRLFPSARYSIWLDSKLRLQRDPLLILEYLLWRKGFEYAISNHYDRHCLWEEVAQNKKLNKFNHTIIDQQFAFYQADGLKRFNASDPNKLLPSNVPEGSFIVRAHTPMSNLFSCLWFNEVDRFTPRDQLSFAYTYHKLKWMNPGKSFNLNMFKDCERRVVSKLYRHRTEDKRILPK